MTQIYLKWVRLLRPKIGFQKMKIYALAGALAMLTIASAQAQERTVSGKVIDSTGESLVGVSIVVKGTLNGTVADLDGNYSISVSDDATLVFSYVGFATQEILVGPRSVIDVTMIEDYGELDEVVVIGYGTTKKSDLTGAVTAISENQFNKGQVNTPQDLLTGRIAGVNVTTNNGEPGGGATIRIRGGSSLSASNDPLIVIDGVPLTTDELGGLRNPLSTINPQDIETVTVLKDASATAIYGARASNGVILITTKRGEKGKGVSVSYNAQFSLANLPNTLDVLTGPEYRTLVQEQIAAGNISADINDALGDANTDWQDEIFTSAFGTTHDISARGDFKGVPFRASIGYLSQEGTLRNQTFDRTSFSLGLDPTLLNDDLKINLNFRYALTDNDFTNEGTIGAAVSYDPTQPVRGTDTAWGGYSFYGDLSDPTIPAANAPRNPVALLEQTNNNSDVGRIIANANFNYSLPWVEGLSANLNVATDRTTTDGLEIVDATAQSEYEIREGQELFGKRNKYDNKYYNDLVEFYFNYQTDLTSINSNLQVTAGYSYQDFFREEASSISKSSMTGDVIDIEPLNVDPSENRLISYYGRIQLNTAEKYLFTATLRRDGSSRFLGDNQWGLFPSAAFAWRIKDESFLSGVDFLSDLKVRAGYGVTAQENVGESYPALARIGVSQDNARYQFASTADGQPIFINLARFEAFDPNLKWEETTTINFGVDYAFWNGRITGSFDYYFRETTDLLSTIPIAAGINFSDQLLTNVGNLENEGVEFTVSGILVDNSDWQVNLGYNLTINDNRITRLTAVDDPEFPGNEVGSIEGGIGQNGQINSVGFNRNTFWLYQQVYGEDGNPIEGQYVDRNGDGLLTDRDRVRDKNPDPTAFMGFNGSVAYKKLSLGFNARLVTGNYVYNNNASNLGWLAGSFERGFARNRITDELGANFVNIENLSNIYVENASFFRMDNVTLAYQLDRVLSDDISAALSFTVQNAFVITDYSGLDPEILGGDDIGIDKNLVPRPRTFTLGLLVNFK